MSKLLKLIPYEKWRFALNIVKHNGGMIKSLEKMWRMDTLKIGTYKGTDSFGNKYFENPYYMVGRSRWVEYNPAVKWHYDASQVTPEWFGWLHYKTDKVPEADCPRVNLMKDDWAKQWLLPHEENLTGTNRAYYPYSTTKPHIQLWDGLFVWLKLIGVVSIVRAVCVERTEHERCGRRCNHYEGAIPAIDVDATLKILFCRNEME